MSKTALVMRQELINHFGRLSYLLVAFGLPLLAVVIVSAVVLIRGRSEASGTPAQSTLDNTELDVEGYVDPGGLIYTLPDNLPQGTLVKFKDEDEARAALDRGAVAAYYLIPGDYVSSGEIFYIYPDHKSLTAQGQHWVMSWTLMLNLVGGDSEAAGLVWNPVQRLEETQVRLEGTASTPELGEACLRPGSSCQSNELIRLTPSLMAALLFIMFQLSGNYLLQSISIEKENRTMELLLLSASPRQVLVGKTIAQGIAGLGQIIAWLAAVFTLFTIGGSSFNLPEGFVFPANILLWSLPFFLGGYALYASLMAGLGALVPKMKEATAATFFVTSPLMLGYVIAVLTPLAGTSTGPLAVTLSIVPLTSPVVMIMRLTDGPVPLWQLLTSLALLFLLAYVVLGAVGAMFRAQNLLSGQPFSIRRYSQVLLRGQ